MSSIKEIFAACQHKTSSQHFINQLNALYKKTQHAEFSKEFFRLLHYPLSDNSNSICVNRILQVVALFILNLHESVTSCKGNDLALSMHPLLKDYFNFLFEVHNSTFLKIRKRTVLALANVLKGLNELIADEDLLSNLTNVTKLRMCDTSPAIRSDAVLLASYLQDPRNPDCPIIKNMMFFMTKDTHYVTRKNAVECIALNKRTLGAVLQRVHDGNNSVRCAAITRIATKVPLKCLSISQRNDVLNTCFKFPELTTIMEQQLLPSWYKSCHNKPTQFIHCLDVSLDAKRLQKVLNIVFKTEDLCTLVNKLGLDKKTHLLPIEKLTEESAFYWLCLCQYVRKLATDNEDALDMVDELTPTCTAFSEYIKSFFKIMEAADEDTNVQGHGYTLEFLLELVSELDFCDTYGLKVLHDSMFAMIESPTCLENMTNLFVKCLKKTEQDQVVFMREIAEFLFKLMDYEDVSSLEESISMIRKCLRVAIEALKLYTGGIIDELDDLKEKLIVPCLPNQYAVVREYSITAMGLYCMRDLSEAKSHLSYFVKALRSDPNNVKIAALNALFDLLLHYNVNDLFSCDPDIPLEESDPFVSASKDMNLHSLFNETLIPILDSLHDDELRHVAAVGFTKMMWYGRISTPQLFMKLILVCYNPDNDDDTKLKSWLSMFFSTYATSKQLDPRFMEDSFLLTMENLYNCDILTSSLSAIDPEEVAKAFLQIFHHISTGRYGNRIYDEVAARILNFIWKNPKSDGVVFLSRYLCELSISSNKEELMSLTVVVKEKIQSNIKASKNVMKFLEKVNQLQGEVSKGKDNAFQETTASLDDDGDSMDLSKRKTMKTREILKATKRNVNRSQLASNKTLSIWKDNAETSLNVVDPESVENDIESVSDSQLSHPESAEIDIVSNSDSETVIPESSTE